MSDPISSLRPALGPAPSVAADTTLHLCAAAGPGAGSKVVVRSGGAAVVGRSPDADLAVTGDAAMSRHHFAVEHRRGRFQLVDMGSANGTLLGDQAVSEPALLADGDTISAGHSTFTVHLAQAARDPRRHRVRCGACDRLLTVERAAVPVDEAGHVLAQPNDGEAFVCRQCRDEDDGSLATPFPGYRTVSRIGTGSMGSVFLVERERDGELFALKCLRPDVPLKTGDAERFLREAASLSALRHPNIIGYVDHGVLDGELFLVMRYVQGVDLDIYRRQAGGRVSPARCVQLMGQVLDGLDYAHRQGFVHRDVKPANILVGVEEGAMVPKLTDFGLAKRYQDAGADPITRGHVSFGTPDYMPPEQITSFRSIGPASDIYAVGATLYHLLSGDPLYHGVAGADPIRTLLERDPPPLGERAPWLADALVDVVQRALRRDPKERWPAAGAFRDALQRATLLG